MAEKPDQITEEEVTFHREKKICLICKGEVGGFIFMCTLVMPYTVDIVLKH